MSRSYDNYRREVDEYLIEKIKPRPGFGKPGTRGPGGGRSPEGGGRSPEGGKPDGGKPDGGKPDGGKPDGGKKPDKNNTARDVAAGAGGRTVWDRVWDTVKGELSTAKDIIRSKGAPIKGVEGKKEKHHSKGN